MREEEEAGVSTSHGEWQGCRFDHDNGYENSDTICLLACLDFYLPTGQGNKDGTPGFLRRQHDLWTDHWSYLAAYLPGVRIWPFGSSTF